MESRWTLKKHWIMNPGALPVSPAVRVEGTDEFTGERFDVTIHYDLNERGVVVKGISTDSMTAALVRILPFDAIRASILESLIADPSLLTGFSLWARIVEETGSTATEEELASFRAARESVEAAVGAATKAVKGARPKRGRGADNDDFYPEIANLYLDFHGRYGQKCVKAMAEHLDTTPPRVSEWVRRARKIGWLSEAPGRGLAGGNATWRLMQWNEEQEEEK